MKKRRREPSQAKSMVMQQKYRSKQQKALKGKGSYSRTASHKHWVEALVA